MEIFGPDPVVGLPAGSKNPPRADFRVIEIIKLLEQKGYRVGWSRAALCPCTPVNDQTQQAAPNCPLCLGSGWLYFRPQDYAPPLEAGVLTELQTLTLDRFSAVVIKGVMTGLSAVTEAVDRVAQWVQGMSVITVRPENQIGYWDRIVGLDSQITYTEICTATAQGVTTKYPVIRLNLVRSVDQRFDDRALTLADGQIRWIPGQAPAVGTRLAIHYTTFPVWVVTDYPRAVRDVLQLKKTTTPVMPTGDPVRLPIQASVRYEFLS